MCVRGVEWGGSVVCCEGEVGGVWRCLLPGVGAGMWRAESPPWLETERGERRGTVDRDQVRSPHIATPQPAVRPVRRKGSYFLIKTRPEAHDTRSFPDSC